MALVVWGGARVGHAQPSLEQVWISDDLLPKDTAMSGTLAGRRDTGHLVAALQLYKEGEDNIFDPANLKTGPIWLPNPEAMALDLRICADILSLNGLYSADVGHRISFEPGQKLEPITSLLDYILETKYATDLKAGYEDSDMLARMFIATDCLAQESNLYLPLSVTSQPDSLLVVFESGDAGVTSELRSYDRDKPIRAPLKCVSTTRVDGGYDCTLNYRNARIPAGVYELVTVFRRNGRADMTKSIVFALPE